ncbi:hypothetical protein N9H93_04325 [Rhizobiaceae bacterium]|nr:hypothetical protein [Rhizobiaceae bacterium]
MRRLFKWSAFIVILMVAGSGVAFTASYPAVAAATCPGCYGFEKIDERLYVGQEMTPKARGDLQRDIAAARKSIASVLRSAEARPFIFACSTNACDHRIGGRGDQGARAQVQSTPWFSVVRFGPRGMNETILTHELAHVAMHDVVGALAVMDGRFPAWLNEGMAVIVSNDERYIRPGTTAEERCLIEPDGPLPADPFEWASAAGQSHQTLYARAACASLHWLEANGGTQGLINALQHTARTGDAVVGK